MLQPHDNARVTVESSGNFWVRLYEALEENSVEVVLSNPLKTKAIAKAWFKTDWLDASILVDLGKSRPRGEVLHPAEENEEFSFGQAFAWEERLRHLPYILGG